MSTIEPQSLFANYIIAGLGASLSRAHAAAYVMPEADRQQAWHLLSFALKSNDAWSATRSLILALAPKMEQAGYWKEWIPYLEKGIICSRQSGDLLTEAKLRMEIGYLLQRLGQFEDAQSYLSHALRQFRELVAPNYIALTLARLATIALNSQQMAVATQCIDDAFEIQGVDRTTKAFLYLTMGHIYFDQKKWEVAKSAYENAMSLWQEDEDQRRIALSLQNLGRIRMSQTDYQEALQCYDQAASKLQEIGDTANLAVIHMNTGVVYSLLEKPDIALVYYEKAEHVFQTLGAMQNLANIYTNKGIEYANMQDWHNAEKSFQHSVNLWGTMGNRFAWANALDGLGLAYLHQSQHQKALHAFQEAIHLLESLPDLNSARSLLNEVVEHLSLIDSD